MRNSNTVNAYVEWKPTRSTTHGQLAVSNSAVSFPTFAAETRWVEWQVTGAAVRRTTDGVTAPTSSKGFSLAAGSFGYFRKEACALMKFIREGGTDAVIEFQEYSV